MSNKLIFEILNVTNVPHEKFKPDPYVNLTFKGI